LLWPAFAEAFSDYLQEWRDEIKGQRKAGRMDPYDDPTTANICIEGLALIRLAQQEGITTEDEYANIPNIAIAMQVKEFPDDFAVFSSTY